MSDLSKKARADMRSKARRMTSGDPHKKVDSSSWTPTEPLNTTAKTGARPVRPRIYKAGGKVQGDRGPRRADRKPRASGGGVGKSVVEAQANRNMPGLNAELGKPHEGAYAKGGKVRRKRDMGGMTDPRATAEGALAAAAARSGAPQARLGSTPGRSDFARMVGIKRGGKVPSGTYFGGTRPTGGRMPHAKGGRARSEFREFLDTVSKDADRERKARKPRKTVDVAGIKSGKDFDQKLADWEAKQPQGGPSPMERDMEASKGKPNPFATDRDKRARGGRTKGKTNINIVIAQPHGQQQAPQQNAPVRPPVPVPPPPPMGMPAGMPPMAAAPPMGGPNMPPPSMAGGPPMPRASGGRTGSKGRTYKVPKNWEIRHRSAIRDGDWKIPSFAKEEYHVLDGRTDHVVGGATPAEAVRKAKAVAGGRAFDTPYTPDDFRGTDFEKHPYGKKPGRAAGGKVYRKVEDMDAGSGGGLGRLEKIDIQKASKRAAGGKTMHAGAGSGLGRLEKIKLQENSHR